MVKYDVCIFGAGPAGSAMAKRLVEFGYSVVVVEKVVFPRQHVGISLSPGVEHWLRVLGIPVSAELSARSLLLWESDNVIEKEGGWHVDRGWFDQLLLNASGARVIIGNAYPIENICGEWDVFIEQELRFSARFLVAATGRRPLLKGRRRAILPVTVAGYARCSVLDTFIEAGEDCWYWGGGGLAFVFADPGEVQKFDSVGAFFVEKMRKCRLVGASSVGEVGGLRSSGQLGGLGGSGHLGSLGSSGQLGGLESSGQLGGLGGSGDLGSLGSSGQLGGLESSGQLGGLRSSGQLGGLGGSGDLGGLGSSGQLGGLESSGQLGGLGSSSQFGSFSNSGNFGEVKMCTATAYVDESPVGKNFIKIGDAVFTMDPLSAQGVQKALKTAVQGAVVVNTILKGDEEAAMAYYEGMIASEVRKHVRWTREFYGRQGRFESGFWEARSSPDELLIKEDQVVRIAAEDRVVRMGLGEVLVKNPAAVMEKIPVMGQEFIQYEYGIKIPGSDEPFVYVNERPVVEMVSVLDGKSVGEGIRLLGMELVRWMVYNRVMMKEKG